MEYLASEPMAKEFYQRSLFVPGHLGLAKQELDDVRELELAAVAEVLQTPAADGQCRNAGSVR